MRAALEAWLRERWFGASALPFPLRLVSGAWGAVQRLRRALYRHGLLRRHAAGVPVLVVGNRTVGGAGKTPVVIALAQGLGARGWRVGVVSRGFGRRSTAPASVDATSRPDEVGDEPLLVHRETGVPVEVDRDRVAAVRRLAARGCDLVLADDGLQHLRLARRLEIEVEDARGLGNGRVLPAGPLREPLPAVRAFARIVQGRPARDGEIPLTTALGEAQALSDPDRTRALSGFVGHEVQAVAGIGDPPRFFAALRAAGLVVRGHAFPDHHRYAAADFAALPPGPVLMTAKDAVKCEALGLRDAWVVPLVADLPDDFLDHLDATLRAGGPDVPA